MKVGKCGDNPRISWHAVERVMQRCELPGTSKVRSFLRKAWKEGITASWEIALPHHLWNKVPNERNKSLRRKYKNSHYKVFGDLLIVSRDNTLITVWRLARNRSLKFNLETAQRFAREMQSTLDHGTPAAMEALLFKYTDWLIRMLDEGFFDEEEVINESR